MSTPESDARDERDGAEDDDWDDLDGPEAAARGGREDVLDDPDDLDDPEVTRDVPDAPEDDDWDDLDASPPRSGPGPVAVAPRHVPPDPAAAPARLRFDEVALTVTVRPGTVAGLGRDPEWAPCTAAALAEHRTVSRRHASVTVAADGTATVTEEPSGAVNRTRLNGVDLIAGQAYPLTDGDRLWLGSRISCVITLGRAPRS
ncbi:FHA domain-containing protein [Streptomyces sp. NPDC004520]|uniref:FHA domain-containing protein n=1 Tax=Streptomyces sp. NPDC004520 TaxID=3364702 RepID=UPI0036ACB1AD